MCMCVSVWTHVHEPIGLAGTRLWVGEGTGGNDGGSVSAFSDSDSVSFLFVDRKAAGYRRPQGSASRGAGRGGDG